MSKNNYGNRYPGSGTVNPGLSNSKPETTPEVEAMMADWNASSAEYAATHDAEGRYTGWYK